jgi:hypothetical protein
MRVGNLTNFREFINAPIYIGRDTSDLQEEIDTNSWTINITADDQRNWKEADFQVLFRRIYAKSYYYLRNSGYPHGLIFYLCFDERSGQLRFSFISDIHKEPPLKAKVNKASFAEVIHQCLTAKYVAGIANDEFEGTSLSIHACQDNSREYSSVKVYVRHFRPFVE